MADFGYDVADYIGIDPLFGTMADFDALLAAAHGLGLRVILDLVPNHTSDRHPWFIESRSSRDNPKRDWYIWRDPAANGGPPNNWLSEFGGSAWEYDAASGQYYYHAFLKEQPDLNWRNPLVREAIYDACGSGSAGGRRLSRRRDLAPDQGRGVPRQSAQSGLLRRPVADTGVILHVYSADRPEVHDVIAEMRRVSDEYPARVLIGEIYLPVERLVAYYGRDLAGAHLPFNFAADLDAVARDAVAQLIARYEAALPHGGWPNWVLGNHDQPRVAARLGPRAGARRRNAAADLARNADDLLRRRDRHGARRRLRRSEVRDPSRRTCRASASAATGCRTPMQWDAARTCRLLDGAAVAAAIGGFRS